MDKQLIKFGKRMDSAEDKKTLISYCEGAKRVLDLGAGTGAMAREIAEKYGCHVDAVDLQWKAENSPETKNVSYIKDEIGLFVEKCAAEGNTRYDCVILSAIIHELDRKSMASLINYLPKIMSDKCRILIREPLFDFNIGPVLKENSLEFIENVFKHISGAKFEEYIRCKKKSGWLFLIEHTGAIPVAFHLANFAFVLSYGPDSWEREKYEYRYACSLNSIKRVFDFSNRPYTGFKVNFIKDMSYRKHFVNAGIPGRAFDLIEYTGMHVIIDYSR